MAFKSVAALFLCTTLVEGHPFGLAPFYHTIEMMWLQDFSSSFEKDLPVLHAQFGDAIEELKWVFPHSRFGLAGFVDKPIEPFGYNSSADYCYQLKYPLTRYTPRIRDAFSNARVHSGGDWAEATLDAMLSAALSEETRWSAEDTTPNGYVINRLIVVVTDSGFHKAGDAVKLGPNNGDGSSDCTNEDYASVNQLRDALESKKITPFFLVTKDVLPIYRRLVHDLGDNGLVWQISDDRSDVRHALSIAVNAKLNNDCQGSRCDGGCVGEQCCPGGSNCDDALVIHFDQIPKDLKILVNEVSLDY